MSDERERLKEILKEKSILRGKFRLSSGIESDFYIDARLTTLDPEGVYLIAKIFFEEIIGGSDIHAVGGPIIGADPIIGSVLSMSHQSASPLRGFLVRKEEKQHGTGKLIEGNLNPGDNVAVVEDVVTTGESVLRAINAVKDAGADVKMVLVIVDREQGGREKFEEMGMYYYSIFKIGELL